MIAAASPRRLGVRLGRAYLYAHAAALFAFLYGPILILLIFSFNDTRSVARWTGLSLEWYARLFSNRDLLAAARNSLVIGAVATTAATALGTLTALGMERTRFRLRAAWEAVLYLPVVIPEIVMGISLLLFFNLGLFPLLQSLSGLRPSLGLGTIIIGHIVFDIPFVYLIVRARLVGSDPSLEEAAQDLGADPWQTFWRVTFPLLLPAILGGALMAFTLSLDDYLVTVFTAGAGSPTLPIYVYSSVRRGVTPEINALSTVLLTASMVLVAASLALQRRR